MRRQRLLVVLNATELDAQPEPALARAVFLARETNAALVLFASNTHPLHTVMPGKAAPHAGGPPHALLHPELSYAEHMEAAMSEHTTLVEDLLRRFGIGSHKVHLALGKPSETLPAFAREVEASLVVMGVVSKGTLERLLIGNTAEKVLDDLRCDILVIKAQPLEARVEASDVVVC